MGKLTDEQKDVWRDRLIRSARLKNNHVKRWEYIRELYKGKYHAWTALADRVDANYILANERQMLASLYGQPPKMYFRPIGYQSDVASYVAEQVADYERRQIDCDVEEEDAVRNALRYGTGILKHGWQFESSPEIPYTDHKAVNGNSKGAYTDSGVAGETELPDAPLTEWNPKYRFGHPWVRSIHPVDFFQDPDALTPAEARWFAHRYRRPWINVVQDSRFDKKARKDLKPSGQSIAGGDLGTLHEDWYNNEIGQDTAMVSLYEIFDRERMMIITMTDTGECLLYEPYNLFGQDGPYEIVQFLSVDDEFWALSWVETFLPQALTGNKLRTQAMDHFMRFGAMKGAYDKMSLDQADMDTFAQSPAGSFIGLNLRGQNSRISEKIQVFPYVQVPADLWTLIDRTQFDADQVSGLSELARGTGKSINTATEASYVQQQAGVRIESMRAKVDKMLRNSTRKMMKLLKQFWGPERVYPIAGPDGQTWQWMQIPNEIINSAFEVDVEPGSTERINKQVRIRQIIDGLSTLAPYVPYLQQQGYDVNWVELFKQYLKAIEITRSPDRLMMPMQQMQPQMAQSGAGGGDAAGQMSQVGGPTNVLPFPGEQQMPMQTEAGQSGMTQSQMFTSAVPGGV